MPIGLLPLPEALPDWAFWPNRLFLLWMNSKTAFLWAGALLGYALCSLLLPPETPAPRRDTLIEGGGDPWIQPPYHRRSIGVDPDSRWDLG